MRLIDYVISAWQKKTKFVEDTKLFLILIGVVCTSSIIALFSLTAILYKSKNYVILFIMNLLLFTYNRPVILLNIFKKENTYLFLKKDTLLKYISYINSRENFFFVVAFIVNVISLPIAIYYNGVILYACIGILVLDIVLLDYFFDKKYLVLFIALLVLFGFVRMNPIILVFIMLINSIYVFKYFYIQIKLQLYKEGYVERGIVNHKKMSIFKMNKYYFARMPHSEYIEFFVSVIVVTASMNFLSSANMLYLLIILNLVEIELLFEKKQLNSNILFGKRNFLEFTNLSPKLKFLSSDEGRLFLQYNILFLVNRVYYLTINKLSLVWLVEYILLIVTSLAIAYRFYKITDILILTHKRIKETFFSMYIIYFILLILSPMLFEKILLKYDWYCKEIGYVIALILAILLFIIPVERVKALEGE